MDQIDLKILTVKLLKKPLVSVDVSDGFRYLSNLESFSSVYCFPKAQVDWENTSVTAQDFNLTWKSGFEVHVGQIIDHSISSEPIGLKLKSY